MGCREQDLLLGEIKFNGLVVFAWLGDFVAKTGQALVADLVVLLNLESDCEALLRPSGLQLAGGRGNLGLEFHNLRQVLSWTYQVWILAR